MSRIRDIANLFSGNTDAATDAEVASAISAHNTSANGHVKRGNTASRPASPSTGDLYYDTTINNLIRYNGTAWVEIAPVPNAPTSVSATAGNNLNATISFTAPTNVTVSSYTVTSSPGNITSSGASSPITVTGLTDGVSYTFTVVATGSNGTSSSSSASNSITAIGYITAEALILAGGGGGGTHQAGGGGAGGLKYYGSETPKSPNGAALSLTRGITYTITVGAGGNGSNSGNSKGSSGTNSSISGNDFTTITCDGGGGGGSSDSSLANGINGGSGGGGSRGATSSTGGTGISGQGNNGGNGGTGSGWYLGGGGGGAGGAGVNASQNTRVDGGAGLTYSITGSSVTYAGGGGGGANGNSQKAGAGGSLIGGEGGAEYGAESYTYGIVSSSGTGSVGRNAVVNRGSGGGGSAGLGAGTTQGGNGSSGIVILKCSNSAASTTGSPTYTTSGGNHIYQFTQSGSITF